MQLFDELFGKYKPVIILGLVSVILLISLVFSIRSCNEYKNMNNNNIVALTDSIRHYKTKNNELYVSKTLLLGDLSTLKLVNDSLVNVVKEMGIKNPAQVIYIDNTIDAGEKETTWVVKPEISEVYPNLEKKFAFNDKYRELEGTVSLKDSLLGLNIEKDKVFFDYTLAVEGTTVYVKSNNPYVQYNKIQGITIKDYKKQKTSLVIGPSITYGYDLPNKKFAPTIGVSATWGLNISNLLKK